MTAGRPWHRWLARFFAVPWLALSALFGASAVFSMLAGWWPIGPPQVVMSLVVAFVSGAIGIAMIRMRRSAVRIILWTFAAFLIVRLVSAGDNEEQTPIMLGMTEQAVVAMVLLYLAGSVAYFAYLWGRDLLESP